MFGLDLRFTSDASGVLYHDFLDEPKKLNVKYRIKKIQDPDSSEIQWKIKLLFELILSKPNANPKCFVAAILPAHAHVRFLSEQEEKVSGIPCYNLNKCISYELFDYLTGRFFLEISVNDQGVRFYSCDLEQSLINVEESHSLLKI